MYGLAVTLIGIHVSEMKVSVKFMFTQILIVALVIVAKNWTTQCPSAGRGVIKLWSIYTMECHSAINRNRLVIYSTTFMNLKMHYSKWSNPFKWYLQLHLYNILVEAKLGTENRLDRGCQGLGMGELFMGGGGDGTVLHLDYWWWLHKYAFVVLAWAAHIQIMYLSKLTELYIKKDGFYYM